MSRIFYRLQHTAQALGLAAAVLAAVSATGEAFTPGPCLTLPGEFAAGSLATFRFARARLVPDGGDATLRYEPAAGFRLIGIVEDAREPVATLAVSRTARAEMVDAGHVVAVRGGVLVGTLCLRARVRRVVALSLSRPAELLAVAPGQTSRTMLWIRNLGNAPDTVTLQIGTPADLRVHADPVGPTVIPAGDSARVALAITLEGDGARDGTGISLQAQGAGRATAILPISRLPGRASFSLPTDVFVGSAWGTDPGGPTRLAYAFSSRGEVAGVALSLQTRSRAVWFPPAQGFEPVSTAPVFLLRADAANWSATVGDLYGRWDRFTGHSVAGRGAAASLRHGRAEAYAEGGSRREGTSQLTAGAAGLRWATENLSLGVRAMFEEREQLRAPVLAVSAGWRGKGHSAAADGGWFVRSASPGASAEYAYSSPSLAVGARARHIGAGASPGQTAQEASLTVSGSLGGPWRAFGNASHVATAGFEGRGDAGTDVGRVGLTRSWSRLSMHVFVGGRSLRRPDADRADGAFGGLAAFWSRGPLAANLSTEGMLSGGDLASSSVRGSLRWSRPAEWVSVSVARNPIGPRWDTPWHADVVGSVERGPWRVEGLLSRPLTQVGNAPTTIGRLAVGRQLAAGAAATVALEHLPHLGWRTAIGVRRRLSLAIPGRPESRDGIVFLDMDGDGARDRDEPGVAGAMVRSGESSALTDHRGRFIHSARGNDVAVEASTLPVGWLHYAGSGSSRVVPLVRPAALAVRVHLLGGDDPRESDSPFELVSLVLRDADGGQRIGHLDALGGALFSGLPPGRYVVALRSDGASRSDTVMLSPGASAERVYSLPDPRRRIVFTSTPRAARGSPTPCFTFHFESGSSAARGGEVTAFQESAGIATCLRPDLPICVVGRADHRGSAGANLRLSLRRAESVRDFLEGLGTRGNRITVVALGATHPLAPGTTPAALETNRSAQVFSGAACPP